MPGMSDYGPLRVGDLEIRPLRNEFPDDLLMSFCDQMTTVTWAPQDPNGK